MYIRMLYTIKYPALRHAINAPHSASRRRPQQPPQKEKEWYAGGKKERSSCAVLYIKVCIHICIYPCMRTSGCRFTFILRVPRDTQTINVHREKHVRDDSLHFSRYAAAAWRNNANILNISKEKGSWYVVDILKNEFWFIRSNNRRAFLLLAAIWNSLGQKKYQSWINLCMCCCLIFCNQLKSSRTIQTEQINI